jgi:hypothetical protein
MSDEMAFWFPNFSRAVVGASSATGVLWEEGQQGKIRGRPSAHLRVDVVAAATAAAAPAPGIAPNPSRGNAAAF